jgi:hypothetical protein
LRPAVVVEPTPTEVGVIKIEVPVPTNIDIILYAIG